MAWLPFRGACGGRAPRPVPRDSFASATNPSISICWNCTCAVANLSADADGSQRPALPDPITKAKPVSRKSMLEEVWGLHEDTDTRAIDNFIVRLRRYMEDDPAHPRHLVTVRGIGYRFVASPDT